jgi:hypothetical protein
MKWLKQVFAQRYNRADGRIGHIWGDRYGSRVVEGEVGEEKVGSEDLKAGEGCGVSKAKGRPWDTVVRVRPQDGETATKSAFSLIFPLPPAPAPG